MPRVTVITATYNCADLLELSLRSLVAQDYQDFDAWIIGDGCTDRSADVVAGVGDPRLHWINLPGNTGSQSEPNNEGLRRASGELIAYLGHDDLWFPWHLTDLVACLDATHADFAHSLLVAYDRNGPSGASGQPPEGLTYADHYTPPSAWLHRHDGAERWGLWRDPATLAWAVDFDYSRRAAQAGARFAFAPRLGTLKFPSSAFRSYARGADASPQTPHLEAMTRDAAALERQVLQDLAASLARHPQQSLARIRSDRDLLRRALAIAFRRRVVDRLRQSRLTGALMRRWFQKRRARLRASRGLPSRP